MSRCLSQVYPQSISEEGGDQPFPDEVGKSGFQCRNTDVIQTADKYDHDVFLLVHRGAVDDRKHVLVREQAD